jgi:protoporphyrinogen oxidase
MPVIPHAANCSSLSLMLEGVTIGGGISGLTIAHFPDLSGNPEALELWEASDTLGGTIGADRMEGYSVDW